MIGDAIAALIQERIQWIRKFKHTDPRAIQGLIEVNLDRRAGHTTAAMVLLAAHEDAVMFVFDDRAKDRFRGMANFDRIFPYRVADQVKGVKAGIAILDDYSCAEHKSAERLIAMWRLDPLFIEIRLG